MIFRKKKPMFNKTWIMVKLSDFGELLNVDHRKIVIMRGNIKTQEMDYSDELLRQLSEKYPVIFNISSSFDERPYDIIVSNRFELGRLGISEE